MKTQSPTKNINTAALTLSQLSLRLATVADTAEHSPASLSLELIATANQLSNIAATLLNTADQVFGGENAMEGVSGALADWTNQGGGSIAEAVAYVRQHGPETCGIADANLAVIVASVLGEINGKSSAPAGQH